MSRKKQGAQSPSRLAQRPVRRTPARLPAWIIVGTSRQLRNAFFVFIAGLVLFSIRLDVPEVLVFDEHSYVPAANGYGAGVNLEPSHPPLGKMIIAAGIQTLGDNPAGWRIASAVAGAMILALVYGLTRQLSGDTLTAVMAVLFTAANGMLFVLARTGMLDAISIMFLFAGLLCVTAVIKGQLSPRWGGALAGCAFGLCMACKWMALLPMAACWAALWLSGKRSSILAMIAPFFAAYVAPFLALAGLLHVVPTWPWFRDQQVVIYTGHAGHIGPDENISRWWAWPLKMQPQVMNWRREDIGTYSRVLLLGNPVVMWLGLAALLVLAYQAWRKRDAVSAAVFAAYVVLYGQYIVMPLKTEFYHYYLAAALCLGPALALATRTRPRLMTALAGLALWSFVCEFPSLSALPGGQWTRFF